MLWIRGLIFTVLVPAVVAFLVPAALLTEARRPGGIWNAGWVLIAAGTLAYLLCLLRFLLAGGTPAIFFTRPLRLLIGEEPGELVAGGLYRFSRNPMYVAVLMVIFGQAVLFRSVRQAVYGCIVFAFFHLVVVFVEEPHLRAARGRPYERYCRAVPRWLGLPGRGRKPPRA
jgi:protein-S-isoprenylcysteine O-methyltransferase Ste14